MSAMRRDVLRRGFDCLIGASLVYAMLLVTTTLSTPNDRDFMTTESKLYRRPKLLTSAEPTESGDAISVATAALSAAEEAAREESNMRHSLEGRLQVARARLEELRMAGNRQQEPPVTVLSQQSDAVALEAVAQPWPYADASSCTCPAPRLAAGNNKGRPPLSLDDVAFGVLTSERFVDTRLASQQRTWLRRVRHVVFYSESHLKWLPTVKLEPPRNEELVGGGAWKNFPALMDLYRRFPSQAWIFFNDDDTYVFVENLLTVLGKYDHRRDYYVGLYWTPRVDMEWKEVQIAYASGGAGYALSRNLLARLAPTMPMCHDNYTRWAGDVRVGKCINNLGVRITPAVGFHHEPHDKYVWDSSGGNFPYGHLTNIASASVQGPATFHHLNVDQISLYNRMQLVETRGKHGELYRWDFSPFMLREYIAYVAPLKHRFRLLFGISFEVADGASGGNWRKDFADPLFFEMHSATKGEMLFADERTEGASSSATMRFEMGIAKVPEIFNGDGCATLLNDPRREPPRKAVIVEVICRPCPPSSDVVVEGDQRSNTNKICSVQREDDCTLRAVLSLRCPPRETVYAPQLDLGVSPGGSELLHAGAPASCFGDSSSGEPSLVSQQKTAPSLPWIVEDSFVRASVFYARLTHGTLQVHPPTLSVASPAYLTRACTATIKGDGAFAVGGLLRAADGSVRLHLACTCDSSVVARTANTARASDGQTPVQLVNLTMRLHVPEYTSPLVTFPHACALR